MTSLGRELAGDHQGLLGRLIGLCRGLVGVVQGWCRGPRALGGDDRWVVINFLPGLVCDCDCCERLRAVVSQVTISNCAARDSVLPMLIPLPKSIPGGLGLLSRCYPVSSLSCERPPILQCVMGIYL